MARHNPYIRARPKKTEEKESGYEKEQKTKKLAFSILQARGEISPFDLKDAMKLTYSLHERLMTDLKNNYPKRVSWNKKKKLLKYIGEITAPSLQQDVKHIEKSSQAPLEPTKPVLSDNELSIMQTMKQEVKQ